MNAKAPWLLQLPSGLDAVAIAALKRDIAEAEVPFKRGLNWNFTDLRDARPRPLDPAISAPARSPTTETGRPWRIATCSGA